MTADRTWHTTATAAEYAPAHPSTVRKALEAGELCGSQRKAKGRWRIHVDCLDAWVKGETCLRCAPKSAARSPAAAGRR